MTEGDTDGENVTDGIDDGVTEGDGVSVGLAEFAVLECSREREAARFRLTVWVTASVEEREVLLEGEIAADIDMTDFDMDHDIVGDCDDDSE